MIDSKKMFTTVFKVLRNDKTLMDMLDIPYDDIPLSALTKNAKQQILFARNPSDLLEDSKVKICIYEESPITYGKQITGSIRLDVFVTHERNKIDTLSLLIIDRLIQTLDTKQRKQQGLSPLPIGIEGEGLFYNGRKLIDIGTTSSGYRRDAVVFHYSYLII